MTSPKDYFEKNKYVYLTNAIDQNACKELTQYMFKLKEEGKLTQDDQCPLSWSIYGDPVLEHIQDQLLNGFSQAAGKDLIPTYTYARIYETGEELKKHSDRPSCEISATMTVGFDPDSQIWPIFFREKESDPGFPVVIEAGDAVLYRGTELEHWRPVYKGKWQVQVFFHYVDADGPHKEWAHDKRRSTDHDTQVDSKNSYLLNPISDGDFPLYCVYNDSKHPEKMFTKEQCEKIVSLASERYATPATVGGSVLNTPVYNKNIREVEVYDIQLSQETEWIYQEIASRVSFANKKYYNFDLTGILHSLQLLHYKSNDQGHYDWHMDCGSGESATRKLSLSIELSDEKDYTGGDLEVHIGGDIINTSKGQGVVHMFPSFCPHRVTPVTYGERWALVVWVHGPNRFR